MISVELLSIVTDIDERQILDIDVVDDLLIVTYNEQCKYQNPADTYDIEFNVYGIAHKCKEWAFNQGYELFSRILSNDSQMRGNCLIIKAESDPETVLKIENEKTEPEAIFKACQWILDNGR